MVFIFKQLLSLASPLMTDDPKTEHRMFPSSPPVPRSVADKACEQHQVSQKTSAAGGDIQTLQYDLTVSEETMQWAEVRESEGETQWL